MAFSVSPSVIVREVDASASVPAIATPPAAIAGLFRWGPTNEPILITSETELVNRFAAPNADNYETFFTAADYLAYANALWVVRADDGVSRQANNAGGAFQAKYKGELGDSLEVAWVTSTGFENAAIDVADIPTVATVNGLFNANNQNASTQSVAFNASTIDFIGTEVLTGIGTGDKIIVGNNTVGYQELNVTSFTSTAVNANNTAEANSALVVAASTSIGFKPNYTLAETDLTKVKITKNWEYSNLFTGAPSGANNIHVSVVDSTGQISGTAGTVLEIYENLSVTPAARTADGRDAYFETVLDNSAWIELLPNANTALPSVGGALIKAAVSTATSQYEVMANGASPTANSTTNHTETGATLAALGPAWDALKNDNEIDLSFVLQGKGDDEGIRANYIISNVADYRKDCVAFISPSKEAVVDKTAIQDKLDGVLGYRNKVQNSSYSFMDSGYKYRYDKYNDVYRWTPLNGDMAGLASRVEVWESPAGYRKGVIKNVIKLAFNPSKPHRDQLYSKDVNPVMSQAGQGIILFGDKTGLGVPSAFDRLNVRRLFIAVEKAIATAAKGFLFELNDDFTQSQFKNIVDPFLRDIQGRRGIIDFRVVSDATVNTPAVVDQNKFRANIYIQPARSINVIELTFVATRSGVEFDEIVGSIR